MNIAEAIDDMIDDECCNVIIENCNQRIFGYVSYQAQQDVARCLFTYDFDYVSQECYESKYLQ